MPVDCLAFEMDSMFEESNGNSLQKCAEVFYCGGLLLYYCTHCKNDEMIDELSFKKHFKKLHLKNLTASAKLKSKQKDECTTTTTSEFNEIEHAAGDALEQELEDVAGNSSPTLDEMLAFKQVEPINDHHEEFESILEYDVTPAMDYIEQDETNSDEINRQEEQETETTMDCADKVVTVIGLSAYQKSTAGPYIKGNMADRPYKCKECGYAFKESYNLRQHLKRHLKAERYQCAECTKGFHTKTEYNTHMRRHLGVYPYMCEECGRRFITAGDLHQHSKRHKNLRTHKCDKCERSFYDVGQLKHHYIVHTTDRPFVCKLCSATFSRRKSMINHMKIHANKREYICQLCLSAFNQASGLRVHMRNKHKDVISVQESLKQNEKAKHNSNNNIDNEDD